MPETGNKGGVSVVQSETGQHDQRADRAAVAMPTDWWRSRDCVVRPVVSFGGLERLANRPAQPVTVFKPQDVLAALQIATFPQEADLPAVQPVEESRVPASPFAELTGRFLRGERVASAKSMTANPLLAKQSPRSMETLLNAFQSLRPPVVLQPVPPVATPVVTSGMLAIIKPTVDASASPPVASPAKRRRLTNPIIWDWSTVVQEPVTPPAPEPSETPEKSDTPLPSSLLEALPTALQQVLPEILGKVLPEAFLRLPMETRQQLVRKMTVMGGALPVETERSWTPSLTEQQQLNRFWSELWEESVQDARKKAARKAAMKAARSSGRGAPVQAPVSVEPVISAQPTVVVQAVEPPPPVVVQAVEPPPPVVVQAVEPPPVVVQAVEPPPPVVVQAVEPPPVVVQAVEPPPPVVVQAVEPPLVVVQAVEPPPPVVEQKRASVEPQAAQDGRGQAGSIGVGSDGSLIAVESLGGGVLHLLTDAAGGGLAVTRRLSAQAASPVLPTMFYEQMGGTVYYGGRSVVAGVAGVIAGSVGVVVGTAGCVLGAIGSVGRGVLGVSKAAR